MGEVLQFDGTRMRRAFQDTSRLNINKTNKIYRGNQWTQLKLWPVIENAASLKSAVRTLGGAEATLNALKAASPNGRPLPPTVWRKAA